jgi:transcriptional regulator with XRE-family HTH domain
MRLAARIKQVRFQHLLSLEELAHRARISPTLLAKIESGHEIPSSEMVESLAAAMGVRIASLFYDDLSPTLTPWLTARPTLQQLAEERFDAQSSESASRLTFKGLRAASAVIFSLMTMDCTQLRRRHPAPRLPSINHRKQNGTDSSARGTYAKPKP